MSLFSAHAQSEYSYADPFIGCEASKLPEAEGIAKNWWKPKAQVGNTHPGACYPFGMVSVCPYSGGYPTGYGLYETSTSGLPGNDDSGGTSAWYVWNAMGLFPFAGTDKIFIGSPMFDRIDIDVAGGTFSIVAENNSEINIYVRKATLNGKILDRWHITAEEFTSGGTLVLEMGDK